MKTRHSIRKKSDEKKARRNVRRRRAKKEGEEDMDPFALAGKDYLPSLLGDIEKHFRLKKKKKRR